MRNAMGVLAALMLLASVCSWGEGALKEPTYSSTKPLYSKLVLNEDASRILTLVFDESGGTGKGYDTLYADVNVNCDLTDDSPIKGNFRRTRYSRECSFPAVTVAVPYNEKGAGAEKPWQFVINYYQFIRPPRLGRRGGAQELNFLLQAKMALKDTSGEWHYSFDSVLGSSEKPTGILAGCCLGKPILTVHVQADGEKKGNVGIAADPMANWSSISWTKGEEPAKAHVEVKDEKGNGVLAEDVELDKMSFG